MRFRTILSLATLFVVCLTIAVWSEPLSPPTTENAAGAAENQSVAGKIASIGDASFSVDVQKSQEKQTVEFQVDGNTKIDGKLTVGAQASVEYRSDNGRNIALHVVVTPASG